MELPKPLIQLRLRHQFQLPLSLYGAGNCLFLSLLYLRDWKQERVQYPRVHVNEKQQQGVYKRSLLLQSWICDFLGPKIREEPRRRRNIQLEGVLSSFLAIFLRVDRSKQKCQQIFYGGNQLLSLVLKRNARTEVRRIFPGLQNVEIEPQDIKLPPKSQESFLPLNFHLFFHWRTHWTEIILTRLKKKWWFQGIRQIS